MDKSMINIFLILVFFNLSSCTFQKEDRVNFIFTITDSSKEKIHRIKLDKYYRYQQMEILENTLVDTCMIGIIKLKPKQIGKLYKIEFMDDSIPPYSYKPLNNVNGKLIIKHYFYNE